MSGRVVVTGSKGNVGATIVGVLREAKFDVVGVDVKPAQEGEENYIQLDLRDAAGANDAFAGAHAVVHFGSVPSSEGMTSTAAFHAIATAGFNVFQAARNAGVRRVVWASSVEAYGELRLQKNLPIREDAPLYPDNIYGSCKVVLESLARDFSRQHGLSIAGLRLTRVIYDSPAGLAKLRRINGNEAAGADCLWSYVDSRDVARACLAWIQSDVTGAEVFNISAEDVHLDVPIRELLRRNGYGHAELTEEIGEHQTPLTSRKARDVLRWKPQYDWRSLLSKPQSVGAR